jgi:hypothetical protein
MGNSSNGLGAFRKASLPCRLYASRVGYVKLVKKSREKKVPQNTVGRLKECGENAMASYD